MKKDNIPNYFIPETNILEQYSQIVKKNSINSDKFIEGVRTLTNRELLIQYICETFIPFSPIAKKFSFEGKNLITDAIFSLEENENSYSLVQTVPFMPSHHHLYQRYKEIIQKQEHKRDLLSEICLTF